MKTHDSRIEELLHNHTFDKLSTSDKNYVLSEMSAPEYNHLHRIIHVAKHEDINAEVKLPSNIKTSIKKSLKDKWHRPKRLITLLAPFLWIAIGALFAHFIWNSNNGRTVQKPVSLPATIAVDTVYIKLRDTIVREVEAPPIVQIKEVIKYIEIEKSIRTAPTVSTSNQSNFVDSMPTGLAEKVSQLAATGISISKEEELMDLLTPFPTDDLD